MERTKEELADALDEFMAREYRDPPLLLEIAQRLREMPEGERIEGWSTKYRAGDAIYFKPGDREPNSKAGRTRRATLFLHERKEGESR